MPSPLIEDLLAAGERLRRAIESQDFERTSELAIVRGVLMDRLIVETTPAMHTVEEREALMSQHSTLEALLTAHAKALRSSLTTFKQHQKAHTSYHTPLARSSILHTIHG